MVGNSNTVQQRGLKTKTMMACGWGLGTRLPGLVHKKHNTTQHNTTLYSTAYLKERIFVEVDWFQENITIMTLGLASTAVRGVRGREGE